MSASFRAITGAWFPRLRRKKSSILWKRCSFTLAFMSGCLVIIMAIANPGNCLRLKAQGNQVSEDVSQFWELIHYLSRIQQELELLTRGFLTIIKFECTKQFFCSKHPFRTCLPHFLEYTRMYNLTWTMYWITYKHVTLLRTYYHNYYLLKLISIGKRNFVVEEW